MIAGFGLLMTGCLRSASNLIQVNVEVVDEKTLLERQIFGSYQALGRDLILVASVRSVDADGRLVPLPDLPPGQRRALNALRVQEFYRDDVERLSAAGVLGEDSNGRLQLRDKPQDPKEWELAGAVAHAINDARAAIVDRILETNEHLGTDDRTRVETTFASIHQDAARPGVWIQRESGTWVRKGA